MYIVYQTTNLVNNKIYIGVHYVGGSGEDSYLGSGLHLKRALNKYGKENFVRETLEVFPCMTDAYTRERELVDSQFVEREDTYNLKVGGRGAGAGSDHHQWGCPRSEAVKAKMSRANTGRVVNEATRAKIRASNLGKKMSEEAKLKMSLSKRGRYCKEAHPRWGIPHSAETKVKIGVANRGKKRTLEVRERMRESRRGKGNANSKWEYHTPKGIYYSPQEAGEANGVDRKTCMNRCEKADILIKRAPKANTWHLGLTWRQLGYWREPSRKNPL